MNLAKRGVDAFNKLRTDIKPPLPRKKLVRIDSVPRTPMNFNQPKIEFFEEKTTPVPSNSLHVRVLTSHSSNSRSFNRLQTRLATSVSRTKSPKPPNSLKKLHPISTK